MTVKSLYPSFYPTLDLNFANSKALDPRISFTRGSAATCVGSNGLLETVASNTARFDHNPATGESLGLLVEEARTNSIRNNTMVGAVAGTPGTLPTNWAGTTTGSGLSRQIVAVGTVDGINYIRLRISGTTSTPFAFFAVSTFDALAASTGQTWTGSTYCQLQAGSLTGVTLQHEIARFAVANAYLGSTVLPFTPGSSALIRQRYALTTTVSDATLTVINYGLQLVVPASGTVVDFTVDIGLPQLEQGAFATSVIPTDNTAAGGKTRAADIASITGTAFSSFYNQTEGTVYSEGGFASAPLAGGNRFAGLIAINDGTLNNYIGDGLRVLPGFSRRDFAPEIYVAGVQQFAQESNNTAENASAKFSIAYKANDCNAAFSVGPVNTTDTSVTIPTVTQMQLGVGRGGTVVNGHIRRLAYFPTRLSNATLRTLTQ